jgi:transcriptional regulator with XRE-family HTH domain
MTAMQKQLPVKHNDDAPQSQRADIVNRHVGSRIRERRHMLGMSQQQLAGKIGVTYQQAFKYEHGANRISAGRLFAFAQAMNVNPSWFFEGMQFGEILEPAPHQRRALELMRNFLMIENAEHQEALCQMARSLADQPTREEDV